VCTTNFSKMVHFAVLFRYISSFRGTVCIYSESSIYHSRIIHFPRSVVQFLWSLSESYFKYGSRNYCFPGSIVSFSDPRRKRIEVSLYTVRVFIFLHREVAACIVLVTVRYICLLLSDNFPGTRSCLAASQELHEWLTADGRVRALPARNCCMCLYLPYLEKVEYFVAKVASLVQCLLCVWGGHPGCVLQDTEALQETEGESLAVTCTWCWGPCALVHEQISPPTHLLPHVEWKVRGSEWKNLWVYSLIFSLALLFWFLCRCQTVNSLTINNLLMIILF
jgi:hypothetical protein